MAAINKGVIEEPHRPYLGMSILGHNCERYLWYTFRWCYTSSYDPRIMRLFKRGDREEPEIIETLKSVGVHVFDEQQEVISIHGHSKGHIDGKCIGVIEAPKTVHLAEFKTMSDKYFKEVKKKGVKASKPVYYAQMQCYMKHTNLTRALFVAVNKNDDDMYIERVYYDEGFANDIMRRGEQIILSEMPPKKKFEPTWYECKWCDAKAICHGTNSWDENCRTCKHVDLLPDGEWSCNRFGFTLATGQQRIGCKKYETIT